MHIWASRVLKPKIQAGIYQVSRSLKSANPRASRFVSTDNLDNRSGAWGYRGQPATSSISINNIENTQADIIDLTNAFGSSTITDSLGWLKGHDQHFDRKEKLKESTDKGLFAGSPYANTDTGTGLFGSAPQANTNKGLFGSSPRANTNKGLFGSATHATTNTFWGSPHAKSNLFGSSSHANTSTGLFGSSPHINTGKYSFGESARPSTSKDPFGSFPWHDSPNRKPFGSNEKVDDESDHDSFWKRPTAALKATGRSRLRSLGTAGVEFSSYKEDKDHYQTITSQWPYQKYSLEELRLDDYEKGHRYDGSSVEEGDGDQSVDTDATRSEEDSNFDPDDDACDHSHSDDCSCLHSISESEGDSECDEDSEPETSDGDDDSDPNAFDRDTCTSNSDYWNKLDRESVLQALLSRPLSGERRIDWPLLNAITRGLCTKDRRQVCILADHFRNPNGTCSVPLELVIRLLSDDVEEDDSSD